jgi:hypothetical protein
MFTALDMHDKREALKKCEGIDEWLEYVLFNKFNECGNEAIVYASELSDKYWKDEAFKKELYMRGFDVEPVLNKGDIYYYVISYPSKAWYNQNKW